MLKRSLTCIFASLIMGLLITTSVPCYGMSNVEIVEEIKRPGCANVLAAVHSVGNLRPDLVTVQAEEIKCSLIGDDECLFRAVYEIK